MIPYIVGRNFKHKVVQLVDEKNNHTSSIYITKAAEKAKHANLDLVCFNEADGDKLPLCKIIDYGKWKYSTVKSNHKVRAVKKTTKKEMRFTPLIQEHDIDIKLKKVKEFLEDGHEVEIVMQFKGIHKRHRNIGEDTFNDILKKCEGYSTVKSSDKGQSSISSILVRIKSKSQK